MTSKLTQSHTPPVDSIIVDGDQPSSELWNSISSDQQFQRALVDAVRELLADTAHFERVQTLLDAGTTAGECGYARHLAGLDRPAESDVHQRGLSMTAQFGTGEVTAIGHRLDLEDLDSGPLAVFGESDVQPTVAVKVGQSFRKRRRDQREDVLKLLGTLATSMDVRVVCSGLTARWLCENHPESIPNSFRESCSTRPAQDGQVDVLVEEAVEEIDTDSLEHSVLEELYDDPGETMAYDSLLAAHKEFSQSRISQILGTLEELELIEKWGPRTDQRVDLLQAGVQVVDQFRQETARQRAAEASFSDPGQNPNINVLPQPHGSPPQHPPDQTSLDSSPPEEDSCPYRTRYLDRPSHHAAAGSAENGSVTLVSGELTQCEAVQDRRTRRVSFDDDRDEAVVAVHASTPIQMMTSLALALSSPRLFDKALPAERLENIDEPPHILRNARCIGCLSDEAIDDPNELRSNIQEWAEDLREMTVELNSGEFDDRDRFCAEILRSAHGLAGSIIHLLDVVGVNIVREFRIPGKLSSSQLYQLSRTISISSSIQSRYGTFSAYRQLFEKRDGKRKSALSPIIDAEDPYGSLIGGIVIRSPKAERIKSYIVDELEKPKDLHEDAPEFEVHIPVQRPGRPAFVSVATRMLKEKGMRPSPESITMLRALSGSPHAAAEALRWLESEDDPRQVRVDEIRVALKRIDPDRLLRECPPSVRKAVSALLCSSEPLSRSELAEKADISKRSIRRNLDVLLSLDLVRDLDDGLRLSLPYRKCEKGETILPDPVETDDSRPDTQGTTFEAVLAAVDMGDAARLADPDSPLGKPFCGPPVDFLEDIEDLLDARPELKPWVALAQRLTDAPTHSSLEATFGRRPAQKSLSEAVAMAQQTAD